MLVGIPPYYNDNIKVLYQNIERGKLKIPNYLTNEAKRFLTVSLYVGGQVVKCNFNRKSSIKTLRRDLA